MTTARAVLLGALLVTAAILVHAYVTQPARYRFATGQTPSRIKREDTRSGEVVECERTPTEDGATYKCPAD